MGLLESILKRQVRRIVNNALDEVVDNTIGVAIRDTFGQNGREGTQNYNNNYNNNYSNESYKPYNETQTYRTTKTVVNRASGEKVLRQRLEEVFRTDYPDYEVRKNLDSGVYGANKYSYGLYYNGMPRMMIMVISDGSHNITRGIRRAKEASASYGVPYLNFFAHLPNETDYVRNRIRANM